MSKIKKLYTTGQIAKMISVAPRTVSVWFDEGALKGFRIPLSKDRRVPRKNLIDFLENSGMPLDMLDVDIWHHVLFVGGNSDIRNAAQNSDKNSICKYHEANSVLRAGAMAARHKLDLVIVDLSIGISESMSIAKDIINITDNSKCIVIGIVEDDEENAASLKRIGFDEIYQRSKFEAQVVINHIEKITKTAG